MDLTHASRAELLAVIAEQQETILAQRLLIQRLEEKVRQLEARIRELEARLGAGRWR